MRDGVAATSARKLPQLRRAKLPDVVAPWSAPVLPTDHVEAGIRPEPPLPAPATTPESVSPRSLSGRPWVGVGLTVGAGLIGTMGATLPSVGAGEEMAPATSLSLPLDRDVLRAPTLTPPADALKPGPAPRLDALDSGLTRRRGGPESVLTSRLGALDSAPASMGADPHGGMLIAGGVPTAGPTAAAARHYPAVVARKGDHVAHGVNFSHLISDEEFTDSGALTSDQIQACLKAKGSFLATFQENHRSAAQIVADAAVASRVNPRIILATLEKETSLVNRHHAPHRVPRSAVGYGHDDGGSTAGRISTFTYQVGGGTKLLRDSHDQGRSLSYPRKLRVDYGHRTIHVDNAATCAHDLHAAYHRHPRALRRRQRPPARERDAAADLRVPRGGRPGRRGADGGWRA